MLDNIFEQLMYTTLRIECIDSIGNIFSIGDIVILAGPYHMDKEDFEYKWKTFKEGDIRKGIMNADDNFSTYFIKNPQRLKGKVLSDIDCKVIKVNNADLNFGFIYEKK